MKIKRLSLILLAFTLMLALFIPAFAVLAEESSGDTYMVRVFGGENGTVYGQEVWETRVSPGSRFTLDYSDPEVVQIKEKTSPDDPDYHATGIRESGRDDKEGLRPSFKVVRDIDIVIAYGVNGTAAKYVIQYLDTDGEEIMPTRTYTGSDGEVVLVPYLEKDGYYPSAYNLKGKLDAKKIKEFTFIYTPDPESGAPPLSATIQPTDEQPAKADGQAVQADEQIDQVAEQPVQADEQTAEQSEAAGDLGEQTSDAGSTVNGQTDRKGRLYAINIPASPDLIPELVDIDDGTELTAEALDNPVDNIFGENGIASEAEVSEQGGFTTQASFKITIIIIIAAAAVVILLMLRVRKKRMRRK